MSKLKSLTITNFKSIENVTVDFENLTLFVGPNASGKSNLLDAISFVSDALAHSLNWAVEQRGGIGAVRRNTRHGASDISITLNVALSSGKNATYFFKIGTQRAGEFSVTAEYCKIFDTLISISEYKIVGGIFEIPVKGISPKLESDRLALTSVAALPEYRELYDFLTNIRIYSLLPNEIRKWQEKTNELRLNREGKNVAAVLFQLEKKNPADYTRICELLREFIPSISKVVSSSVAQRDILSFEQSSPTFKEPLKFRASNMSEGTLRIFGILLALVDPANRSSVIGIEEPEITIHPALVEKLMDFMIQESEKIQIILTTHSPEILDSKLRPEQIRLVWLDREMLTHVDELGKKTKDVINKKSLTAGELLKNNELYPEASNYLSLSNFTE